MKVYVDNMDKKLPHNRGYTYHFGDVCLMNLHRKGDSGHNCRIKKKAPAGCHPCTIGKCDNFSFASPGTAAAPHTAS